jgi:oligosaccharide repeat unit polymerase
MLIRETQFKRVSQINGLVLAVQIMVMMFLLAVGLLYEVDDLQSEYLLYSGCVFFLLLVLWSFWSWILITKRLFDPYFLFLISVVIFNGGLAILEVFHLNTTVFLEGLNSRDLFSYDISLKTLYLVTFGLATLHFGALVSAVAASHKTRGEYPLSSKLPLRSVYRVGLILLFISVLPTLIYLRNSLEIVLAGGYVALYQQDIQGGIGSSFGLLAQFLFPGAYFVIVAAPKNSKLRIFAVIFVLLYSGVNFFIGARSTAVMPLVAMLWLWNSTVRPLPKGLLIGIALLLLGVVFPLIGAIRNQVGSFSLDSLLATFTSIDNPILSSFAEMGSSIRTVAWTIQLVPDVRDFALGTTYLKGVLVLIPNVFGAARNPILSMFGYEIQDYWLVGEVDPYFANRGGSFGFSLIAEAYLNFGWAAPLALGVIGLLYGYFVAWAVNDRDPAKMAIIAIFVSSFLFYARGSSELITRPLVWYTLFPYLLVRMQGNVQPNSNRSRFS